MSDNDPAISILRELTNIRRRLAVNRFMLAAILAVTVVCLALLLIGAARGMR
ncbi:MAG TPA: hypothetical protein VME41_05880 [Stellaceae bacterium]|nr:hypothetical protein [Stellaceae bacterium]